MLHGLLMLPLVPGEGQVSVLRKTPTIFLHGLSAEGDRVDGRPECRGQLQVIPLEKGFTWLDAGTADSLLTAGQTIKEIQDETGRYVGCLEELGLQEGWITADHVHAIGDELSMTLYGKYLQCL